MSFFPIIAFLLSRTRIPGFCVAARFVLSAITTTASCRCLDASKPQIGNSFPGSNIELWLVVRILVYRSCSFPPSGNEQQWQHDDDFPACLDCCYSCSIMLFPSIYYEPQAQTRALCQAEDSENGIM